MREDAQRLVREADRWRGSGGTGRFPQHEPVSSSREQAEGERRSCNAHGCQLRLVEIKAAAIDLVAVAAQARGVQVVFAENEVVSPELDDAILGLVRAGARA